MRSTPQYALAVDLGGTNVSVALISRRGRIEASLTEPVDVSSKSTPITQINRLAERLAGEQPISAIAAAGAVAVPGLVRHSGTVWAPNLPGWERMPLRTRMERGLKIPFAIESDRNAAAVGETWLGAARGKSDAVMLHIGTGIGAGIISGGRIVRGAHELSGCAGWIVVTDEFSNEVRHVGQLESIAGGPGIARAASKATSVRSAERELQKKPTVHEIVLAARSGDAAAIKVFERAGEMLGRAVANIVSLLDPEIIIIDSAVPGALELYMQSMNASARLWAQPIAGKQVKIRRSLLGDKANLLGAARLAWNIANEAKRGSASGNVEDVDLGTEEMPVGGTDDESDLD